MKRMRTILTVAGLLLLVPTLGVVGAKAQSMFHGVANGEFNLPFQAQLGNMTLPAGSYAFSLVEFASGGSLMVRINGETKGSPNGYVLTETQASTSAPENQLLYIRNGNKKIVTELVLPTMGKAFSFKVPSAAKLVAQKIDHNTNVQSAEASGLVQSVPVKMTAK